MLKRKSGKNKQFDELTEEQQALLAYTEPPCRLLFIGEEIFQAAMLSSGVGVLSFYFSVLSSPLDRIAERGKEEYYVICYHIGFVYLTLGHFEKAYYYLTNAKEIHPFMRFVILPTVSSK